MDLSEIVNADTKGYSPDIFLKPDVDELFKSNLIDRLVMKEMGKDPPRRQSFSLWMSTTYPADKVFDCKLKNGLPHFRKFRFIVFRPTPDRPESSLSLADINFAV